MLWARANGADSLWQLMLMALAFSFYEDLTQKILDIPYDSFYVLDVPVHRIIVART